MKKMKIIVAGILSTASVGAFAAVPAVVGTTITGMQTDALSVIDLIWPIFAAIVGGFFLFKIVKRGIAKL
ncbi:MAG: major coat protein [Gammaproteobacteria bacterium]|nr:major coat protein [Gammaproteobacteria bacterium]